MAVEWTITIEGKNEFGDSCRKEVRIDKTWERLFDGDLGLSIEDGKKIMEALQNAVVNMRPRPIPFIAESARTAIRSGPSRITRRAASEPSLAQ